MPTYRFKRWLDKSGNLMGDSPKLKTTIDKDLSLIAEYENAARSEFKKQILDIGVET